jgi:hypothetical protein
MAGVQVQRRFVAGKVVDAVGDHLAIAIAGEVMVIDRSGFDGIRHTFTVKIAQQFLLFGVNADHGFACLQVGLLELGNLFKLGITVGVLSHGTFLLGLTAAVAVFP